jgi:hypothetical protein
VDRQAGRFTVCGTHEGPLDCLVTARRRVSAAPLLAQCDSAAFTDVDRSASSVRERRPGSRRRRSLCLDATAARPALTLAPRLLRKQAARLGGACFSCAVRKSAGRRGWFGASRRQWTAQMTCRCRGRARVWSECFYPRRPARAARPRLAPGASCLADERSRRKRVRSVADAAPNARRSAGPSDPIVSSTGMPAMCANEITGRSPWCSRRPGGAPRVPVLARRGGRGGRRRSRRRPQCRLPAGS